MISGLEGKIGLLESKQDMTNTGIYYLCQVAGGIKDRLNTKFFQFFLGDAVKVCSLGFLVARGRYWGAVVDQEARSKLQFNRSSSTFSEVELLQGLQFLADAEEGLKTDDISQKDLGMESSKDTLAKTTTLHRSCRSGITLIRKEGLLL